MEFQRWVLNGLVVGGLAASMVVVLPGYSHAQSAKDLYAQRCESCHGTTGKGDGPAGKFLKPPPKDFAVSLKAKSDGWIAKAIKKGGPAVGESALMPASSDLTNQQVNELVDYIKKFSS